MIRGEVWWADLPTPVGSGPGYRRPVLIIQSDAFNMSRIQTVVVAAITSNLELAAAPGNVPLRARSAGLERDSVVNVSQVLTVDRKLLTNWIGVVSAQQMSRVNAGLRSVLSLDMP
jgi:mRNA interferase MazF